MEVDLGLLKFEVDVKAIIAMLKSKLMETSSFYECFDVLSCTTPIHYCIYPLRVRPHVPLVDLLYFEYLHHLHRQGRVEHIIILPFVEDYSEQSVTDDVNSLTQNLKLVYSDVINSLSIITPNEQKDIADSISVMSKGFLQDMKNNLDTESLQQFRTKLGLHKRSNGASEIAPLLNTIKCRIAWKYMINKGFIDKENSTNVGILLWETRIDKLRSFSKIRLEENYRNVSVTGMLGRSKMASWTSPLPVFEPLKTLNLFEDYQSTIVKLNEKSRSELKSYEELLLTILVENYGYTADTVNAKEINQFLQDLTVNSPEGSSMPVSKTGKTVLYLIDTLRSIYHKWQASGGATPS